MINVGDHNYVAATYIANECLIAPIIVTQYS